MEDDGGCMKDKIKPFTTDGCSGGMSWFWKTFLRKPPPWEDLCVEHDRLYWQGGISSDRKLADLQLGRAIRRRGYVGWAILIYLGVRLGGSPKFPFPWRWGYGYKYSGRYQVK